jgi:exodeoxyribonuclease VII large subunit
VVSGVGHEVDVTIADLVADVRAATPSNAAEIVVPERDVLVNRVGSLERRLMQAFDNSLSGHRLRLERSLRPLYGARRVIAPVRRELAELEAELARGALSSIRRPPERLGELHQRLMRLDPRSTLRRDRRELESAVRRLRDAGRLPVQARRERLAAVRASMIATGRPTVRARRAQLAELGTHLDAISPLRVLDRGYAIAIAEKTGRAVRRVSEVTVGDRLRIRVSDGELGAKVDS